MPLCATGPDKLRSIQGQTVCRSDMRPPLESQGSLIKPTVVRYVGGFRGKERPRILAATKAERQCGIMLGE